MDEKHPLPLARPSEPRQPEPSRPRRALLAVFVRVAVIALLALLVLFFPTGIQSRPMVAWDDDAAPQTALTDVKKVPLEAHIM